MKKPRHMAILLVLTLGIGILSVAVFWVNGSFPPSLRGGTVQPVIQHLDATLYGNGTLVETYTYLVTRPGVTIIPVELPYGGTIVSAGQPVTRPSTEVLAINLSPKNRQEDVRWYVVDPRNGILIGGEETAEQDLWSYAELIDEDPLDETVGILTPSGFTPGTYTVTYTFRLHPQIQYDATHTFLQVPLTGPTPYRIYSTYPLIESVTLDLRMDGIEAVFPSPSTLQVETTGGGVVVKGEMVDRPPVQVGILLSGDPVPHMTGIRYPIGGIRTKAMNGEVPATPPMDLSAGAVALLRIPLGIMVILLPLLFLLLYLVRGREGDVLPVPEYLSFVPNPDRKPWLVSFLFTFEPLQLDHNAYYSTILDLHRRGIITLSLPSREDVPSDPSGFRIQFHDAPDLDPYETAVFRFLKRISRGGGTVDPTLFRKGPPGDPSEYLVEEAWAALDRATLEVEKTSAPQYLAADPRLLITLGYGVTLFWLLAMLVLVFGPLVETFLLGSSLNGIFSVVLCLLMIPAVALLAFIGFHCQGRRILHEIRRIGSCPRIADAMDVTFGAVLVFPLLLFGMNLLLWNARIPPALILTSGVTVVLLVVGIPDLYWTRKEMYPPLSGQEIPTFLAMWPAFLVLGWMTGLTGYSRLIAWETVATAWFAAVLVLQAGIALSFPVSLFGRWKEGLYRENLEWGAFRRFLVAFPGVDHSVPADMAKWNEWLVYGTALGVGKNVMRAYPALGDETVRMIFLPTVIETHHALEAERKGKDRARARLSRSARESWKDLEGK